LSVDNEINRDLGLLSLALQPPLLVVDCKSEVKVVKGIAI